MITVEDIIEYVLKTPGNTNPNILRGMLMKFGGQDQEEIEEATYETIVEGRYGSDEQQQAGE